MASFQLPEHRLGTDGDAPPPAVEPRVGLTPLQGAMAGAVAAGASLAAGELVTAVGDESGPTLVTAVGSEFIDRFAASLKELAVEVFGKNDKTALIVGIVVTSIIFGALLGAGARRHWIVPAVGFSAFGAVGAWALSTDPQGSTALAVVAAIVAVVVGLGSLALLWRLAGTSLLGRRDATRPTVDDRHVGIVRRSPPAPLAGAGSPPVAGAMAGSGGGSRRTTVDRRGFLLGAGGLAVGASATAALGRQLRGSSAVDEVRRSTVLPRSRQSVGPPASQPFNLPGLSSYITPNSDFYRIDTALSVPRVAVDDWQLSITGLIDRPFSISYDDLLALDSVEETVTIACVSNEVGGSLVGNAVWQGVPLTALLKRARLQEGAEQVVGRSVDGWTSGFPLADALDGRTAIVAYAMNGEPLPIEHGYPARLIVAGLYGYVSATKWLTEIELTTWDDFDSYWVPRGWSKEGPIKTASRIDVPRSSETVTAGRQAIAGVAWAPDRGIDRVEVQVDDGPWQRAELGRTASENTWVQWRLVWDATPGDHTARVRATDGDGVTQTADVAAPAPDGASGWHSRQFTVA